MAGFVVGLGEYAAEKNKREFEVQQERRKDMLEFLKNAASSQNVPGWYQQQANQLWLDFAMTPPDKKLNKQLEQKFNDFLLAHERYKASGDQGRQQVRQQVAGKVLGAPMSGALNRLSGSFPTPPGGAATPQIQLSEISLPDLKTPEVADVRKDMAGTSVPPMRSLRQQRAIEDASIENTVSAMEIDALIDQAEQIGLTDPTDIANFIRRQYVTPKTPAGGGIQILQPGETLVVDGEPLYTAPVPPGERGRRETITAGPDDTILDADGNVLWTGPLAGTTGQPATRRPTTQWESNLQQQKTADQGAKQWIAQAGSIADAYNMALASKADPAVLLRLLELNYEENRSLSESQRRRAELAGRFAPAVIKDAETLIEEYGSPEGALQVLESGAGPAARVGVKEVLREMGGLVTAGRPRSIFE